MSGGLQTMAGVASKVVLHAGGGRGGGREGGRGV